MEQSGFITGELLYDLLSEQYSVVRYGQDLFCMPLQLPRFYTEGTVCTQGSIFIVRSRDLPRKSPEKCLYLCIGTRPEHVYGNWKSEVFFIDEPRLDLLSLFNTVIGHFNRLFEWHKNMNRLLDEQGEIREFVKASIPVFHNCITIADYDLRLLVNCVCETQNGEQHIRIDHQFDRIPESVAAEFKTNISEYAKNREPFTYKGQRENPEGNNYCINLFVHNTYIGCCVLWDKIRPMTKADLLLFRQFANYIQMLLSVPTYQASEQMITMKNIFMELLQCYPVSAEEYSCARAFLESRITKDGFTTDCWYCIVIQSANRKKQLSEQYVCTSLEDMLPYGIALPFDGRIVCFYLLKKGEGFRDLLGDVLPPYLKDMNFRAGVSRQFEDVFQTYDYYLQALAILKTCGKENRELLVHTFEDFALPYMLEHCTGEFTPEMMASTGLEKLRTLESGVDYIDTLRRYLDNECNASRTAEELFLHRSSLLPRLERIRKYVAIDTPMERLYLRICLHMEKRTLL